MTSNLITAEISLQSTDIIWNGSKQTMLPQFERAHRNITAAPPVFAQITKPDSFGGGEQSSRNGEMRRKKEDGKQSSTDVTWFIS